MRFLFLITLIQSGQTNTQTNTQTHNNRVLIIRALRSRSLRDGLLSHRFATFVCSYWTPQNLTYKYVKPVTSKLHVLNSACFPLITIS